MRTPDFRLGRLTCRTALGFVLALGPISSARAQSGFEESWSESVKKAAPAATTPGLPGGLPPAPTATEGSPTPKPLPTSTPKPTPNPKDFKTAEEYACKKVGTGDAVDPATKETAADKARREWESTQTDRSTKGGRPVPPPYSMPPYPAGATPYMKQCVDAGVPVPPPWGDDRWVNQGDLPGDKTFASNLPKTQVWTYRSAEPPGICYALPRITAGGTIQLLGQICQGAKSGKACFWDNLDPNKPTVDGRIPVTDSSGPTNMAGADVMDLPQGEQCTNCHRGDNVFIIHPGTPLQRPPTDPCSTDGPFDFPVDDKPTDSAKKPYEPIVGPKFTNPKNGPLQPPLKNAACTSCHGLPSLTKGFCGTVLRNVMGKTMPPPDGKMDAADKASVDELKARCAALP